MVWDGKERRAPGPDHDILIRIEESLRNHIEKVERHFVDDATNFKEIRKDVEALKGWRLQILGAVAFVVFLAEFIPKFFTR